MPKKNDPQSKPHYQGLTFKRARFVDEAVKQFAQNGEVNRGKAAAKVYNLKPSSAYTIGSKEFNRVDVRRAFLVEMEDKGLKSEVSIQAHLDAFKATKAQLLPDGNVVEMPDHNIRLSASKEFNKIIGAYAPTTSQSAKLNIYAELTPQELAEQEEAIQDRVRSLEASTEADARTKEKAQPKG